MFQRSTVTRSIPVTARAVSGKRDRAVTHSPKSPLIKNVNTSGTHGLSNSRRARSLSRVTIPGQPLIPRQSVTAAATSLQADVGTEVFVETPVHLSAAELSTEVRNALSVVDEHGYVVIRTTPGVTGNAGVDPVYMQAVSQQVMEVDEKVGWASYNGNGGVFRDALYPDGSIWISAAEGAPKELPVEFHNEMAYAMSYPKRIAFAMFAISSDYQGGQTRLCDNIDITNMLAEHPALKEKMQRLGVQYIRNLIDENTPTEGGEYLTTWQEAFLTKDFEEAKRIAASTPHTILKGELGGPLQTVTWRPLFHPHPDTGAPILNCSILNRHASWFDQPTLGLEGAAAAKYSGVPRGERMYHMLWGDGTELTEDEISTIRRLHQEAEVTVQLKAGDVLIADNLRMQHGRKAWAGAQRVLGLAISGMVDRVDIPDVSSTPPAPLA